MIEAQETKFVPVLAPVSVAGGATATSLIVDTDGFSYASLYAFFGLIGANGVATLKWQESDNADGSSASDITGAAFDALVDADDGKAYGGFLALGAGRKRYLKIVMTIGATNAALASAFAILSRANEMPNTAAERGLGAQFIV